MAWVVGVRSRATTWGEVGQVWFCVEGEPGCELLSDCNSMCSLDPKTFRSPHSTLVAHSGSHLQKSQGRSCKWS